MKALTNKNLLEALIKLTDVVEVLSCGLDTPETTVEILGEVQDELYEMKTTYLPRVVTYWGPSNRSPACYVDTLEEAKELADKYAKEVSGWQLVDRVQVWLPTGIEPYYEVKGGWEEEKKKGKWVLMSNGGWERQNPALEAEMEDYGPELGGDR